MKNGFARNKAGGYSVADFARTVAVTGRTIRSTLVFASAFVIAASLVTPSRTAADERPDAVQAGPRALSRAFRLAAAKATESVVTVFAYGQESESAAGQKATGSQDTPTDPNGTGDDDSGRPTPPPRTGSSGQNLVVSGLGSGVIFSSDGTIVTNNHVVAGAQRVVVQLFDQSELEVQRVSGDADSDIAVLKVDPVEPLKVATLGDSETLEIGDWVLAIGSPFNLETTVSAGIISAKNRSIRRIRRGRLLQTDAAINPGNSGGALIDLSGDVIGINTAIATRSGSYQGIGFAIPINQVTWIANELSVHGKVRRAAMGIRLADLTKPVASKLNLQVGMGVLVYQVIDKSAASQAGIEPLDVIIEFAGERVRQASDLQEIVERKPIGSVQTVKVARGDREVELNVRLAPIEDPTETKAKAAGEESRPIGTRP
jgi:serine protease Do